jgi:hypothetical protein
MSADGKTVRVLEIANEPMRFRVESWSDPKHPHMVDLLANGGAGQCSCKDWSVRRWPAIKYTTQNGLAWQRMPELFCRHVIAARTHFTNQLLARMSADQGLTNAERDE